MTEDLLTKWRPPGSRPMPAGAAAPLEYKAFGTSTGLLQRVWLKCGALATDNAPAYGHLLNVMTDGWYGVTLVYSIPMVVVIRGEYLGELAQKLISGTCEWVQLFEASKFKQPADGSAIVRELEVLRTRPEDLPPVNEMH